MNRPRWCDTEGAMDTDWTAKTEQIMLCQAMQGDPAAWEWLFDRHFQGVYCYCLSLTRGDSEGAEELTQEVFVTAATRLHRYQLSRGTLRSWLLGLARNHHQKRKHRLARLWQREVSISEAELSVATKQRRWLGVYETLALLPASYRLVLEAKYMECLSVKEIAEREQRSVKAMESLLGRARLRFRQIYRKAEES